jgi:hypothetical protein
MRSGHSKGWYQLAAVKLGLGGAKPMVFCVNNIHELILF